MSVYAECSDNCRLVHHMIQLTHSREYIQMKSNLRVREEPASLYLQQHTLHNTESWKQPKGPDLSQETEISSDTSRWVARSQVFDSASVACRSVHWQESGLEAQTQLKWNFSHSLQVIKILIGRCSQIKFKMNWVLGQTLNFWGQSLLQFSPRTYKCF